MWEAKSRANKKAPDKEHLPSKTLLQGKEQEADSVHSWMAAIAFRPRAPELTHVKDSCTQWLPSSARCLLRASSLCEEENKAPGGPSQGPGTRCSHLGNPPLRVA